MERPPWRVLNPAMSQGCFVQAGTVTKPGRERRVVFGGEDFGLVEIGVLERRRPWVRPAAANVASEFTDGLLALGGGFFERLTG